MKPPEQKQSRILVVTLCIGLCIFGAATAALVVLHRQNAAEIVRLRSLAREAAQQLEEKEQALTRLKTEAMTNRQPVAASRDDWELKKRLADISMLQTQTLALIKGVAEKTEGSIQHSEAYREASLAALEEEKAKLEARVAELKQRTRELATTLKVTDAAAAMPTDQALRTPTFMHYEPYFSSRREQEHLEMVLERLKIRLIQETVEDQIRAKLAKPVGK